jgi:Histidine kinase/Histidine kinase-, DNA gyrase B-, and HSP90-like ATPase
VDNEIDARNPSDRRDDPGDRGKAREPITIEPEDTMPVEHHDLQDSASAPSDRTTLVVGASRGPVRGIATAVADAGAPVISGSLGLRERRRLERDLHDGAQQRLVALALTLRLARQKLDAEPDETARLLDRAHEELDQALSELRDLARGIHPPVLANRGLGGAVEALAARAPLRVRVISRLPDRRLPERAELAAYFVVSEALTNIAKHASALNASVALTERDGLLEITVKDDGVGGADLDRGTGVRGLADRVAAIDGRLEIDSKPGHGTIVRARIPCPEPARGRGLRATVSAPAGNASPTAVRAHR